MQGSSRSDSVARRDPSFRKILLFLGFLAATAGPLFFVICFGLAAVFTEVARLKQSLGLSTPLYLLAAYVLALGAVILPARASLWLMQYTADDGKPVLRRWCAGVGHLALAVALGGVYLYAR